MASYSGDANYLPLAPCNAVNSSVAVGREPVADFDGNGTTDVAVYRPSTGVWYVQSPFHAVKWREPGDVPLPLPAAIYRRLF